MSNTMQWVKAGYPGDKYQRLFDAINDSSPNPLQGQMDDIIQIVKEDFAVELLKAAVYAGWYNAISNGYRHEFTWEQFKKEHNIIEPK